MKLTDDVKIGSRAFMAFIEEHDKNKEIVERLKKILEGQTDTFTFTGRYLRQEILGEEK